MLDVMLDCFETASDETCWDWEAALDYFLHSIDPKWIDFLFEDLMKWRSLIETTEHNL